MGLGLWLALSGGCVTDRIPFEAKPKEPPAILDSQTSSLKIGDLFWVDRSSSTEWPMQVVVRDANPNRELKARVRLLDPDFDPTNPEDLPPPFQSIDVPKSGSELRDFPFTVPTSFLSLASCHRLELVVSGSFSKRAEAQGPAFFSYLDEDDAADIAWAKWWVWEGTTDSAMQPDKAMRIVESCSAGTEVLDETTSTPTTPMAGGGALP